MSLIAIEKFIREDSVKLFPKLEKQDKITYFKDLERENLIHRKNLMQGKGLEELIDEIPSLVCEETRKAATDLVEKAHKGSRMGAAAKSKSIKDMVEQLLNEILTNYKRAMVRLTILRSLDEYTFVHSVNVTILSIVMGIELGFGRPELKGLAVAGLLHDIGKIKISYRILTKPDSLTKKEFDKVKKHPMDSYKIIADDPEAGEIAKLVARQHHERQDGSGYPEGLKGEEISNYAGITAVADVYDALTTERPYRKAYAPYEAMKMILFQSKRHFKQKTVQAFLACMSIYPQGSLVKLNTGEIAMVIRTNKEAIIRPVIKLLVDGSGERFKESIEVNLLSQPHRYITGYVDKITG